jgi:hypothetical protein
LEKQSPDVLEGLASLAAPVLQSYNGANAPIGGILTPTENESLGIDDKSDLPEWGSGFANPMERK